MEVEDLAGGKIGHWSSPEMGQMRVERSELEFMLAKLFWCMLESFFSLLGNLWLEEGGGSLQ